VSRDYFTKQRGGYINDDVCVMCHLSPNVVTLWSLLHLRPNVITFRSLLHLSSVITFRSSTTFAYSHTCIGPACAKGLENKRTKVYQDYSHTYEKLFIGTLNFTSLHFTFAYRCLGIQIVLGRGTGKTPAIN